MKTSQQPTSQSGADEWTCSLAAFRASLSVMPGDEEARRMTATSGRQCIAPSTKSSPLGLWLRTLLESSRWSSRARFLRWQVQPLFSTRLTTFEDDSNCERPLPFNASAQTLKVTDMPSSRCLFRLVPSEPPTDETGCSSSQGVLLQTPTTVQTDEPPEKMRARAEKNGYKNGTKFGSLTSQIKYDERVKRMFSMPTPTATMREDFERVERLKEKGAKTIYSRANNPDGTGRHHGLLTYMGFYDLFPTPTAIEGVKWTNTWNPNSQMGQSLSAMAGSGMLPTPVVTDYNTTILEEAKSKRLEEGRSNSCMHQLRQMAADGELGSIPTTAENAGKTSRLSPLFTEEMMGFPLMWTALPFLSESGAPKPSKPTATPSSPK